MCWYYITPLLHSHDTQKLGLKKEAEFLKLYHLTSYLCDSYMACRKQAKWNYVMLKNKKTSIDLNYVKPSLDLLQN